MPSSAFAAVHSCLAELLRNACCLQGAAALVDQLPAYAMLTQLQPSCVVQQQQQQQSEEQPVWLADAVLASRVQFLLQVVVPCTPRLAQVRLSFV